MATPAAAVGPPQCKFFARGRCERGSSCRFSHAVTPQPPRPLCRFFASGQGCRFGESCRFLHPLPQSSLPKTQPSTLASLSLPLRPIDRSFADLVGLGPASRDPGATSEKVLVIGDSTLGFSQGLALSVDPAVAESITVVSHEGMQSLYETPSRSVHIQSLMGRGVRVILGVKLDELVASACIIDSGVYRVTVGQPGAAGLALTWSDLGCVVWNLPRLAKASDNKRNQVLLRHALKCLSVAFLAHARPSCRLVLTLSNSQFSRWQVEQMARESFFFLESSDAFDPRNLPGYEPKDGSPNAPAKVEEPIAYSFRLHPPPAARFGSCRERVLQALQSR